MTSRSTDVSPMLQTATNGVVGSDSVASPWGQIDTDFPLERLSVSELPSPGDDSLRTLAHLQGRQRTTSLPRPPFLVRLLLTAALLLLAMLAILGAFMARAVGEVVAAIQAEKAAAAQTVSVPLPPRSVLLDMAGFSAEVAVASDPFALYEARAAILVEEARPGELRDMVVDLLRSDIGRQLELDQRVAVVEWLVSARDWAAARRELRHLPWSRLDGESRRRAVAVAGRLHGAVGLAPLPADVKPPVRAAARVDQPGSLGITEPSPAPPTPTPVPGSQTTLSGAMGSPAE